MKDAAKNATDARVRLNKYIADCGVASRRKADELIADGSVIVNGKKVYELGAKIDPAQDRITVNGRPLKPAQQKVYLMFNKPRHVVTTLEDPEGRPTIGDFVKRLPFRVFPVGRLDWDTEGLILLTNDGDFSQAVMHPSKEVTKTYLAKVSGQPSQEALSKLLRGVSIVGGRVSAKSIERLRKGAGQYDWIKIVITEGKNRQVKQMFEKIGFDVMKLQRVAIGRLKIPPSLQRGEFTQLTTKDIDKIFMPDPSVRFSETESGKIETRDEPRMKNPKLARSVKGGGRPQRGPSGFSKSNRGRPPQAKPEVEDAYDSAVPKPKGMRESVKSRPSRGFDAAPREDVGGRSGPPRGDRRPSGGRSTREPRAETAPAAAENSRGARADAGAGRGARAGSARPPARGTAGASRGAGGRPTPSRGGRRG